MGWEIIDRKTMHKMFLVATICFTSLVISSCAILGSGISKEELQKIKTAVREPYPYHAPQYNPESFLAGASKIEITPPLDIEPIYIAGYTAGVISQGAHDPIWARCVAITDISGKTIILVSLDVIGFLYSDAQDVIKKIKTFSNASVVISATHTHAGPDTLGFWGEWLFKILPYKTGRNEDYMAFLKNQIVACVGDALENQQPAHIYISSQELRGLSRNLRESSVVDFNSIVLYARERRTEEPIFFLHNFGVHPEIIRSNQLSADFLQSWYTETEKEFGGIALFLNGALGALVAPETPNIFNAAELPQMPTPQYQGQDFGKDIKHAWINADWYGKRMYRKLSRELQFEEINPDTMWYKKKTFRFALESTSLSLAHRLGIVKRPDAVDGELTTEISFLKFGNFCAAFLPGETTPQLSFKLRKKFSNCQRLMMVSLANDELGYLLDAQQSSNYLYAYEQIVCANPQMAEIILEQFKEIIPAP